MCRIGGTDCGGFSGDSCGPLSTPLFAGGFQWGVCYKSGTAPDAWNCDPSYYAAADGCDCGCGIFDPDCSNTTIGSCQYCDDGCGNIDCLLGGCTDIWCNINPTDNAVCI
jgi:hypothetical protein